MNYKKNKKGYVALISVLVIGAAGTAIAVSLLLNSIGSAKSNFSLEQSNQAKALCNSCAEEALQQIRSAPNFSGSGNLSFGQGSCTYTVTKLTGQNRTITSTGTVGSVIRKINASIDTINPAINITAWEEVQ